MKIELDFSKKIGEMKPVNGVNSAPYRLMSMENQVKIKQSFAELHIPFSRTHDVCGKYGGNNYIDIPNVFRNFDADEYDENNYDFHYSDEFLKPIIESGAQVIYRLGITIEWGSKKYRTFPPKDYAKWARICAQIIRHYNEGWANGHHYNIEYWEIWNEPENPPMWSGTKEQFLDLYKVAACYLKEQFPNIKIGGFGSCGFYAVTTRKESPFFLGCLEWFHDFLKLCVNENVPLDFFTWHLYTGDFSEYQAHAKFVRETLDGYGLTQVESHFNEWNVGGEGGGFHLMRNMIGASYVARVLCEMQNTHYVDKAMYYTFDLQASYNGFYDQNLFTPTVTYDAYKAYGDCYALKNQVYSATEYDKIGVVGASDGENCAAIFSNYDGEESEFTLSVKGVPSGKKLILTAVGEKGEIELPVVNGESNAALSLPVNSVKVLNVR